MVWPSKQFNLVSYLLIIALMGAFAWGFLQVDIDSARQSGGLIIFSLGYVLLAAFVIAKIVKAFDLPLITGYILAGILAGPYVSNFLGTEMVGRLKLIDELALSIIALNAGAELRVSALRARGRSIILNIFFLTVVGVGAVMAFVMTSGRHFAATAEFSPMSLFVFALLLGVICAARSPASAIAIINECKARGPFTDTVLAVSIVKDVLIIILFTIALAVSRMMMQGGGPELGSVCGLFIEVVLSILMGLLLGKGMSVYVDRIGHDFLLFLLFIAFGVTRLSMGADQFMHDRFAVSLHLEPLLICISAGFFIQNFSRKGAYLIETLERTSLPIYVLFFSLAGAALDFSSLALCLPLALGVAGVRMAGLFAGSMLAGTFGRDPYAFRISAWMGYITQAGVSVGLAQMVARQFPEIGVYLNTVVLAVIAVNQIIGPIGFKFALGYVGETYRR